MACASPFGSFDGQPGDFDINLPLVVSCKGEIPGFPSLFITIQGRGDRRLQSVKEMWSHGYEGVS